MFVYPKINPLAFSIGPLKVHWYGLMYLFGFAAAWYLARVRVKVHQLAWNNDNISDLIFYTAIGVILGGRVGYMLFYDFSNFIHHPWIIFKVWDGGMSFHGGFLGALAALFFFSKKVKSTYLGVLDFVVPLVPIGLGAGRVGNFINGELWGRTTDVPWAMVYPHIDEFPRHPSELYEVGLEGILLFLILWFFTNKPKPLGAASGLFLLCYGLFRFFVEFFREPDVQLGFIWQNWMTMGQLLSLPMIIAGVMFLIFAYKGESNAAIS